MEKLVNQEYYINGVQFVLDCMNASNYSYSTKRLFHKLSEEKKINVIYDFEKNPSIIEKVFLSKYDIRVIDEDDLKRSIIESGYED